MLTSLSVRACFPVAQVYPASDWFLAAAPGVSGNLNSSGFMKTDDRQKAAMKSNEPSGWNRIQGLQNPTFATYEMHWK